MRGTHPETLADLAARATGLAGAREEIRLGALTPAVDVLRLPETFRLLAALRSRLVMAPDDVVEKLKLLTVPPPASVRPDLALGVGPDDALTVYATVDGKARTRGKVNAPTARLAFGVETHEELPPAVRDGDWWYYDEHGTLVVNQTEAYLHAPAGTTRHQWLLAPDAEWLWLTPDPVYYAPYAPGWATPNLEQVAAVLLACHAAEPREELAHALALHIAGRGSHDYAADWDTGRSSTAPRIAATPPTGTPAGPVPRRGSPGTGRPRRGAAASGGFGTASAGAPPWPTSPAGSRSWTGASSAMPTA
jgi:hypothetical protein